MAEYRRAADREIIVPRSPNLPAAMIEDIVLDSRAINSRDVESAGAATGRPHSIEGIIADDDVLGGWHNRLSIAAVVAQARVAEDVVLEEQIASVADEQKPLVRVGPRIEVEAAKRDVGEDAVTDLRLRRGHDGTS